MKKRFVLLLVLQMYFSQCWALSGNTPTPTLYTYLDNSELVVVGRVSHVKVLESYGAFERGLSLVKLEDAYVIDRNGIDAFTKPVYLYLTNYHDSFNGKRFVYLLSNLDTHPRPTSEFRINDDDTVSFWSTWHGRGLIHRVEKSGRLNFTDKFDSCIEIDKFENSGKRYECRVGDYIEKRYVHPDTRPPMPFSEFELKIQDYLRSKNRIFHGSSSMLHNTEVGSLLVNKKLKSLEPVDNHFIEMLQTVPLPDRLLEMINNREKGRGNSGDYFNDPKLVDEFKKRDAERKKKSMISD